MQDTRNGALGSQAARALGISRRTADRDWAFARARLFEQLRAPDEPAESSGAGRE
jgi:hypothetical protein